jgi:hypothetical protein
MRRAVDVTEGHMGDKKACYIRGNTNYFRKEIQRAKKNANDTLKVLAKAMFSTSEENIR